MKRFAVIDNCVYVSIDDIFQYINKQLQFIQDVLDEFSSASSPGKCIFEVLNSCVLFVSTFTQVLHLVPNTLKYNTFYTLINIVSLLLFEVKSLHHTASLS